MRKLLPGVRRLLVIVALASVVPGACGDDGGGGDPVASYCEQVAEYVQLAQDDPTNPELDGLLQDLEAESADLVRQRTEDPGSIDEARLNECSNEIRQIEPGG